MSEHLNDRYCSVTMWIFADICKGMHGWIFVNRHCDNCRLDICRYL